MLVSKALALILGSNRRVQRENNAKRTRFYPTFTQQNASWWSRHARTPGNQGRGQLIHNNEAGARACAGEPWRKHGGFSWPVKDLCKWPEIERRKQWAWAGKHNRKAKVSQRCKCVRQGETNVADPAGQRSWGWRQSWVQKSSGYSVRFGKLGTDLFRSEAWKRAVVLERISTFYCPGFLIPYSAHPSWIACPFIVLRALFLFHFNSWSVEALIWRRALQSKIRRICWFCWSY